MRYIGVEINLQEPLSPLHQLEWEGDILPWGHKANPRLQGLGIHYYLLFWAMTYMEKKSKYIT